MTHFSPRVRVFTAALVVTLALLLPLEGIAKAKKSSRSSSRSASASKKASAKKTASKKGARTKSARAERGRGRNERTAARGKKESRRAGRVVARSNRRLSRRERLAQARRLAEARRRAELARLAAIARQRAADQALRDETTANIAQDSTIGEDMEVRRAAINALGSRAGTVVVMSPKTGRVLSIVNQDWALRKGFKPCSTIKLVTGLAGLSESVIDPYETLNISAGRNFPLDLTDSLAYSNNGYFQSVGGRVGFDKIISYARQFGLGEATGVNHPNEYAGRLPLYKTGYAVNRMCSHGDDFEVTPMQLGVMASAIGNGGNVLVPHLPRTPAEVTNFKTEVRRRLNISPDHLQRVIPGMIGAVNYGTAKLAYDPMQTIAGKTGTCIGQGSWLGLFASYAPVNNPELAVVVVTRGSWARGKIASDVAGRVYRALGYRYIKGNNANIANLPASAKPQPKLDAAAAAAVNDEDKEVQEATQAAATETQPAGADNTRGTAKSVLLPVLTKPTDVYNKPSVPPTSAGPGAAAPAASTNQERPRRVLMNAP